VPWKNGHDPSVSFDAGTDGVSNTPVLHRALCAVIGNSAIVFIPL
jgi:hypothetical protein